MRWIWDWFPMRVQYENVQNIFLSHIHNFQDITFKLGTCVISFFFLKLGNSGLILRHFIKLCHACIRQPTFKIKEIPSFKDIIRNVSKMGQIVHFDDISHNVFNRRKYSFLKLKVSKCVMKCRFNHTL